MTLHKQVLTIGVELAEANTRENKAKEGITALVKSLCLDTDTGKYKACIIYNKIKEDGEWPLRDNGSYMTIKECMADSDQEVSAFGRACNVISATASRLNNRPRTRKTTTAITVGAVIKAYTSFTDDERRQVFDYVLSLPPKGHLKVLKQHITKAMAKSVKK